MRFLARSLTGLLLLVVTLALLGFAAITIGNAARQSFGPGGPARDAEERVVSANVLMLTPSEITPEMITYGKVEARRTLELRARQVGMVVWVAEDFQNGAEVTEGAALLRLDPVPAEEALALAQADLMEAEAASAEAVAAVELAIEDLAAAEAQAVLQRQALDRQKDLADRGAGSPQAVETAELAVSGAVQSVLSRKQALASAEARVDQTAVAVTRAKIALGEAERMLIETELRAGLSGRIDGVSVVRGTVIGANEGLGRIIDPASLEVALRLSTAQYLQLLDEEGGLRSSEVTVALPGLPEATPLIGRLDRVGAAVGDGQTGRLVYAALDVVAEGLALLKPGDFVEVVIAGAPLSNVALVPATAIGRQGTVLALGPEDRLEEVAVDVLRRQGDDVIIAAAQLAGREIVTERSAFLGEGIRIRPIRPGAEASSTATLPEKPIGG
ncbi:efflux RND transporter periplasmic adaptor subunit [Tabrizicola sp.]|uniref:efflux RND transporter periplasmic adaptor subunit n=1 Tax=Tabrizicola sp. TaxID=2005166 RepID=UPI003F403C6C